MKQFCFLLMLVLLLSGCGGTTRSLPTTATTSSPAPTSTATPGQAQGFYSGTYSYGTPFYAVVLPDDAFYLIDGHVAADGSMDRVWRLLTGQGTSSNGKYVAALQATLYDTHFSIGLDATYVIGTSMSGSLAANTGATSTFTATAVPAAQLNFNTPANLSNIAGDWTGIFLSDMLDGTPDSATVSISLTGQITPVGSPCSYSGIIAPDANKNFFNVTITFGPAPCNLPNQTVSGIAMEMLLSNGTNRQLLVIIKNAAVGFAGR